MSLYLKKFDTQTAYTAAQSSLILPNVSLITENNKVEYNPLTPTPTAETRVVATFNVEYEDSEIKILNDTTNITSIEIDGVEQPSVTTGYTFSTTGEHTVKYTLTDQTSIANNAFQYCYGLTSIVIPYSVTSIGNYALQSCTSLTSCTIGNGVTSIGNYAFEGCGFTNIVIPSNVTNLGELTFYNCGYLVSFTVMATTPPSMNSIFGGEMYNPTIYVPSVSVNAYKAASGWIDYESDIEPIP